MAAWKSLLLLCVVVSSGCITFAEDVAETKAELAGNDRGLKGILGGLLLAKLVAKKKIILGKGLLLKAGIILAKLKALGLLALLSSTGINSPTDVVGIMDMGKICNTMLDVGKSCEHELVHFPEAKHEVHKMHNVIFKEEKVVEEPSVTYVTAEALQEDGKVEYVIETPEGSTTPYYPEEGDHKTEYVLENEDGTYTPYNGNLEDVEVKGELVQQENPEEHKELVYTTVEGEHIEIPEGHHVEVEELAVDVVVGEKYTKYVRYYNERKSGVNSYSHKLLEFKIHCLLILCDLPAFKKYDVIYVKKMTGTSY